MAIASTQAFAADVITRLSSQRLADMMKAAGATEVKITKPEAGVEIVTFGDNTGTMDFVLLSCTAEGCATLQMAAVFNKDDRFTLAALNSYNAKYLNAQASLQPDGNVLLAKLYVPGGGVTEENLKTNMAIFFQAPNLFSKHILEQVTVSLDKPGAMKPTAAPLAQPTLNIGTVPANTGGFDFAKWRQSQPGHRARTLP
jgi:hypothetical protein